MRMIAREAGVSVATVSLALRSHPSIPPPTRSRILEVAQRLDYRPNAMVSALMAQIHTHRPNSESPVLALVCEAERRQALDKIDFYRKLVEGAEARAHALGYVLERFFLEPGEAHGKRLHQILHARNVRGVILAPIFREGGKSDLPVDGFACCAMGDSIHTPDIHRVGGSHAHSMRLAWTELIRRGYRRPGFIHRLDSLERASYAQLGSFVSQQMIQPEAEQIPPLILQKVPDFHFEECIEQFKTWYEAHRPDVLISPPWIMLKAITKMFSIPDDIGVILFDAEPGWTQVLDNVEQIGAGTVETVVAQIHRNDSGIPKFPKRIAVNSILIEGNSLRAAPAD